MKALLKNLGIILVLIAVVVLAVPAFSGTTSNLSIGIAAILLVVGVVSHIFINKKID